MTVAVFIVSLLALALSAHSIIFTAATGWHAKQARLWRLDPDHARDRKAAPPWFVRYTEWLP